MGRIWKRLTHSTIFESGKATEELSQAVQKIGEKLYSAAKEKEDAEKKDEKPERESDEKTDKNADEKTGDKPDEPEVKGKKE